MANATILVAKDTGIIHAYACGICHKIPSVGFDPYPNIKKYIDATKRLAEQCCICRMCELIVERPKSPYCNKCLPIWEKEQEKWHAEHDRKWAEYQDKLEESLGLSKDKIIAQSLRDLMSKISEDYYCAGWLCDLEYSLWGIIKGDANTEFGFSNVADYEIEALKKLSENCGGWWYFGDGMGELFISTEKWEIMYEEGKKINVGSQ